MTHNTEDRWVLQFGHSDGNVRLSGGDDDIERNFPAHQYCQPDKETAKSEGERVLRELLARGDRRDWYASYSLNPFDIHAGKQPSTQFTTYIFELYDRENTEHSTCQFLRCEICYSCPELWKVDGRNNHFLCARCKNYRALCDMDGFIRDCNSYISKVRHIENVKRNHPRRSTHVEEPTPPVIDGFSVVP